jgi:dipeptidyl aminopeptidase/acylaminoacyl peptidase
VIPPGAIAQRPGRPLAIEDYYRIQTVAAPAISRDGRWVVFSVATKIEENNGTRNEVYLVPSDASAKPRRILHDGKDVGSPRWTDDNRLEYGEDSQAGRASGRNAARQSGGDRGRWKIDPADPAAAPVRATSPPPGAVASPDGAWLALASDKPAQKKEAAPASDFERRHEERFKGAIFDWKDFQRDGAPFPAPNLRARPAARIVLRAASSPVGDSKVLVDMDLRPEGLVWHPKGHLLAFLADSHWRDELAYERPDIWTVTTGGRVTRLTDDGDVHHEVDFSPDGRYLSYVATFGTDRIIRQKLDHGGSRDLWIRPVEGGEPINLTAKWDLEPGRPQWSPDSRFLYFTAEIGGEAHLFRAAVPGGTVEQVTKGERRLVGLTIDKGFRTIAYLVGVHDAPAEVYAADIDGSRERRLTEIHKGITAEIAFSRAEGLKWRSHDGTTIEGWLMSPHGYDAAKGPYPLIVTSHGGPHSATGYTFDFKKQYFAANGYFVLDTNFRSSTGYGDAFKWATWGEWGKKDGADVVSGIDFVLKRYPIDPKRVGHTGHSYGGFMTNWLITQYPDRFAAAITGAGISNWMSDYGTADIYRTKETEFFGTPWDKEARNRMILQSPLAHAGNVKTPTLFVHGEVDQRVPYEEGEQMYFALRRRGIPAKMIQYAGQPHGIAGHWNNVHRMINELRWWNTYLGARGAGAPASNGAQAGAK